MCNRLKRIISELGIQKLSDISANSLEEWMKEKRCTDTYSPKTINHYVLAFKQFVLWLNKNNRISDNPVACVKKITINSDMQTFKRRALCDSEIDTLISSTKRAEDIYSLSGFERALIYQIALFAGLRFNEIATLIRSDIDLENRTITCRDVNSKNSKTSTLPLKSELVTDLQVYFAGREVLPFATVFPDMPEKGSFLLKPDLKDAGIEYENEFGRCDFHALRHSYCSQLARSGVSPQVARELMRHSDVNLTMKSYTHILLDDKRSAIEGLPFTNKEAGREVLTGTDDASADCKISGDQILTKPVDWGNNRMELCGQNSELFHSTRNDVSTNNINEKCEKNSVKRTLSTSDTIDTNWWARRDLNPRQSDYESPALTN